MKHEAIAGRIIEKVGGQENIENVWHCMTRLCFKLKDHERVDQEGLMAETPVVGVSDKNDQLQVVIGTDVNDYYETLAELLGMNAERDESDDKEESEGLISSFMAVVSGVFGPIVPAIAGAGMIMGFMSGLIALGVISAASQTYIVINMIASGVFIFLPFFVAASSARIFKTNQYLAIAIAASLQMPAMTEAVAEGTVSQFNVFGLLPVPVFNYSGTVIPIIIAVWALSHIRKFIDQLLPEVLRTVFTSTLSLFTVGLLTLVVIGPMGIYLGNLIAYGVESLFAISPVLAGIVVGGIRPLTIFIGLHHAMTPIALQNFANQGYDMLMPMMFMANLSITGVTAAMYFKLNTKEEKNIAVSAVVSGFLGITEPALFGVLTKNAKAFIAATIGSSAASAFISFFGVRIYGYILSSVFSLPAYIGEYFVFIILGMLISLTVSFAIAYVLIPNVEVKEEKEEKKQLVEA